MVGEESPGAVVSWKLFSAAKLRATEEVLKRWFGKVARRRGRGPSAAKAAAILPLRAARFEAASFETEDRGKTLLILIGQR